MDLLISYAHGLTVLSAIMIGILGALLGVPFKKRYGAPSNVTTCAAGLVFALVFYSVCSHQLGELAHQAEEAISAQEEVVSETVSDDGTVTLVSIPLNAINEIPVTPNGIPFRF